MAKITYECTQCGTEVVVTKSGGSGLRPIYCCGVEIAKAPANRSSSQHSKSTKSAAANSGAGKGTGRKHLSRPAKRAKG